MDTISGGCPSKQGLISGELDKLDGSLKALEESIRALKNQLESVSKPASPKTSSENREKSLVSVPMADRISGCGRVVGQLTGEVNEAIQRLEI